LITTDKLLEGLKQWDARAIGRAISLVENGDESAGVILSSLDEDLISTATILGITGPPGAGKSTLTNGIISQLRQSGKRIGIIAIDPSSPISGGAILGCSDAIHGNPGQAWRALRYSRRSCKDHG
jgi:LAO/AO transport system kinase